MRKYYLEKKTEDRKSFDKYHKVCYTLLWSIVAFVILEKKVARLRGTTPTFIIL